MKYRPLGTRCPDCDIMADMKQTLFRADGMVMIAGECPHCHETVTQEFDYSYIVKGIQSLESPNSPYFDLDTWVPKGRPN